MTDMRQFLVEGLVCGTCLVEVLERLHEVDGVAKVGISLNRGGRSPVVVQCTPEVTDEELHRAVAGAGNFSLTHPLGRGPVGGRPDDVIFAAHRFARAGVL